MSSIAVLPTNGGSPLGLEKLWEGSLATTNNVDDITDGGVSPDDYDVLLVHYEAEVTAKGTSGGCIGMVAASRSGNVSYDMTYAGGASTSSLTTTSRRATVLMLHSGSDWRVLRRQEGMILPTTTTPFMLSIDKRNSQLTSATFHFVVYGAKL